MKVLFIIPEFEPHTKGGICTYYRELLKDNPHWDTTVLQGSGYDIRDGYSTWENIPVHYLKESLFKKYFSKFHHFSLFHELQRHLASAWALYEQALELEKKFDCIVCTDWGLGFVPWTIKKELPVIIHLHGSCGQIDFFEPRKGLEFWSKLYLHLETVLLEKASAISTYSNQNLIFWKERFINKKEINLIAPPFSVPKKPSLQIKESHLKTGLVVARIQYWKGPILLCKALQLLSDNERDGLKIFWAGRDTQYHSLETSMDDYLKATFPEIWRKIVMPVGSKSQDELYDLQQQTGWGLVPSEWDMFNLSAIEHLAYGKPLLCSIKAGASDFVSNNFCTISFETKPESLADAIRKVITKDSSELSAMGANGKEVIENIFHVEKIRIEHLRVFSEAIQSHSSLHGLENSYDLFCPSENSTPSDPAVALSHHWPLKKIIKIASDRLLSKVKRNK